VLGLKRTGAYAGFKVIKALFDKGLITYGWQTYAWSDGRWDHRNHIEQYSNKRTVGGESVDYDRAMKTNFGQWPAKPPALADGRYLKVSSPLMSGSDVMWVQQRLNAHGAEPKLTTDGQYGPNTRDAVKVFQKAEHLTVDGIVGRATWTALAK
jgi:peptidoglycan hydrolase-like protein with peptidoglycan-binding domain